MNEYFVYGLVDPTTNSVFYIGKGKGNRPRFHLNETRESTCNLHKFNKIEQIRRLGSEPRIVKILENLNEQHALDLERRLIAFFGRKDCDHSGCLTNIAVGGDLWGGSLPHQTREKIKAKMSGANHHSYGRSRTQKQKDDQKLYKEKWWQENTLKTSRLGATHTDETKALISQLHKGKKGLAGSDNPMHTARTYQAVDSKGSTRTITSKTIKAFCKENAFNYMNLMTAIRTGKTYKGWSITRL